MVLTPTLFDQFDEIVRSDEPHLEQVLRFDLATSFVKKCSFTKSLYQTPFCLLESYYLCQYTNILVKIKPYEGGGTSVSTHSGRQSAKLPQ